MTLLKEKEMSRVAPRVISYTAEFLMGLVGVVAALFGLAIFYAAPADTFKLFGWEWEYGLVAHEWAYGLFIGAGVLLAAAFLAVTTKLYRRDQRRSGPVALAAFLGLAAFAGAITFALIWIL